MVGEAARQVADQIRATIALRRMSAAKAARALGWSQTYISRRLNYEQAFDVDDLALLAELLEVEPIDFFGLGRIGTNRTSPLVGRRSPKTPVIWGRPSDLHVCFPVAA